jgi:hypothetical protein
LDTCRLDEGTQRLGGRGLRRSDTVEVTDAARIAGAIQILRIIISPVMRQHAHGFGAALEPCTEYMENGGFAITD